MYHLLIDALVIITVNFLNYRLPIVFGSTGLTTARCLILRTKETTLHLGYEIAPGKGPTGTLNTTTGLLNELGGVLKLRCGLLTPNVVIRSTITYLRWVMYFLLLFHWRHMIDLKHFLRKGNFLKFVWIYVHLVLIWDAFCLNCGWGLFGR